MPVCEMGTEDTYFEENFANMSQKRKLSFSPERRLVRKVPPKKRRKVRER